MLSVREREAEKVTALDAGADDYVTKPFGMDELLARIRTALRHRLQAEVSQPVLRSGGLVVDLERRIVTLDGREIRLTPKEYDLLRVLITHTGKVLTHQQLLREVWGPGYANETHYLRIYIGQLAPEDRSRPNPAALHPHRARRRVQATRRMMKGFVVKMESDQRPVSLMLS